ncbi:leucine-rich repeat-containing protein 15-like [Chironomus tepperi]|uniref:leucine-rich repeat-containing protein 15-like n=1 Tax=Chironomus tepperi TaxID=113505 RepID=UPI00391F3901
MEFNHTKDIKTCIPEPFIVQQPTDYAQLSAPDVDCHAFYVKNSNSSYLPLGLSTFLPSLKIFLFKDSNLTEIHRDSLVNLTQLVEVSFYKNLLTKIESEIFRDNKKLKKINFNSNAIESIDVDAFKGLKDLREIYLNGNELAELNSELFRDNHQLIVINLELNKLKALPMTIFNGLTSLTSLNLNYNDLEALPGRLFKDNLNLKILKFSQNLITKTDIQKMDFYDNLDSIDAYRNPCTRELRYVSDISDLGELLDVMCSVECEDRNNWLIKEIEEKTKSYEIILKKYQQTQVQNDVNEAIDEHVEEATDVVEQN